MGLIAAVKTCWRVVLATPLACWFGFHQALIERAADEVFLRCTECGGRTAGWQIERKPLVFVSKDAADAQPIFVECDDPPAPDVFGIISDDGQHLGAFTYHEIALLQAIDRRQIGRRAMH